MPQTLTITAEQLAAAPKPAYAKPTEFMAFYERIMALEGKDRSPTGRARGRGVGQPSLPSLVKSPSRRAMRHRYQIQNYCDAFSYHPLMDPETGEPHKSAGQNKHSHRIGKIILDSHVKYDDDLERLFPQRKYGISPDQLATENGAAWWVRKGS